MSEKPNTETVLFNLNEARKLLENSDIDNVDGGILEPIWNAVKDAVLVIRKRIESESKSIDRASTSIIIWSVVTQSADALYDEVFSEGPTEARERIAKIAPLFNQAWEDLPAGLKEYTFDFEADITPGTMGQLTHLDTDWFDATQEQVSQSMLTAVAALAPAEDEGSSQSPGII